MDLLDELTALHAALTKIRPLPDDVLQELAGRYAVRFTHHSTAIEGNTLTQSETQIVLEKGITIGGKSLREYLEVIGHKEALDFVLMLAERSEPVTKRDIRDVHSLVVKGQGDRDAGAYRTLNVKAAGTEFAYPDHLHVPGLMRDLLVWLNAPSKLHPVEFATEAHLQFVTIHPFRDGNGRVGRLFMNLLLLRAGYTIAVIPVSKRREYKDALVIAQTGRDSSSLLELVAATVGESLRETLQVCLSATELVPRMGRVERAEIEKLLQL